MSTHTIPLSIYKRKYPEIILNIIKPVAMGFFVRDSKTSSKWPW